MSLLRFACFVCTALLFNGVLLAQENPQAVEEADPAVISAVQNYYLDGLIQNFNYSPGKNSYIFQRLKRAERKTILDLKGSGSVRHLWSTWSVPGSSQVPRGTSLLRIYVDDSATPSIVGTVDQLCRAAQATGKKYVPFPAFIYKDAYDFYLPIFFKKSIRIEVEALTDMQEFYAQIDYRLDPGDRTSARLVSKTSDSDIVLSYRGKLPSSFSARHSSLAVKQVTQPMHCDDSGRDCSLEMDGSGVLKKLTLQAGSLSNARLTIVWDDEKQPDVDAPIKYFFSDFVNAAVESRPNQYTTSFPMPFHRKARIALHSDSPLPKQIAVSYVIEHRPLSSRTPYFHALYHEQSTVGYAQYPVLQVHGEGLFVGMNLFDSGHNHGGGDAALIDAGTSSPRVLHGICGEDYFGFAWHHTGAMTPLTGAPVHERRYRLHLENPYPFHESFQLLFGIFAELQPKSVAFWYQVPQGLPVQRWVAADIPWKVLGPLSADDAVPSTANDQTYETTVPFDKPMQLTEHWQKVKMTSGFLDLTYQFRHYALTEKGTGFISGAGKYGLETYVYSDTKRSVNVVLGHDDAVVVRMNNGPVTDLKPQSGFGPSKLNLPLQSGWNKLDLIVMNEENVNWRWAGISLAFERSQNHQDLKFSSEPSQ